MTCDSGRHSKSGDAKQAPSEGCQSVIAQPQVGITKAITPPPVTGELRECPFCGDSAMLTHFGSTAEVLCTNCNARSPVFHATNEAKAIAAWNARSNQEATTCRNTVGRSVCYASIPAGASRCPRCGKEATRTVEDAEETSAQLGEAVDRLLAVTEDVQRKAISAINAMVTTSPDTKEDGAR